MKAPKPKSFDAIPAGTHVARLYQIIYIGTVPTNWQGVEKMTNKVRLAFELCNETKVFNEGEEARPYSISREFTFSMGPKATLRPFIEGMYGVKMHDDEAYNFDLDTALGKECLISVVHQEKDGNTHSNILNASALPKGTIAPELYNEAVIIDINSTPASEIDRLPDFIKNKMYSSEEWAGRQKFEEVTGEKVGTPIPSAKKNRPKVVTNMNVDELDRGDGALSPEEEADIV